MKKTIYTKEKISESVQSLLKKYHAEKAILFGSYARGEATEESDIDLIIVGGAEFEPTDVFAIAEELNRQLDKKVDVYELREIDKGSELYDAIFSDGIEIVL